MAETPAHVYITMTDVGPQPDAVALILSKIQGLPKTPDEILTTTPCRISGKVPVSIAQKVKTYLERAGATVVLETEDSTQTASESSSMFASPGYEAAEVIEDPLDASGSEEPEPAMPDESADEAIEFEVPLPSNQDVQKSLTKAPQPPQFFAEIEVEAEPVPPKRRRRRTKRGTSRFIKIGLVLLLLVVILGTGGWLYWSGQWANLSERYEENPVVGQVGILHIENPENAELSLYQVIGTRVTQQIALEGAETVLRQGDYYVEARQGSQVLRFPVYIEGRGHELTVTVTFPDQAPPFSHVAYVPAGWFRMGHKETDTPRFGFPDERPDIDVYVSEFFISKYEVTNREFAAFVEAGGYEREGFWKRLLQDWPSLVEQVPAYGRAYGNDGWASVQKYLRTRLIDTDDRPGPRLWEKDTPPYDFGQDQRPVVGISLYEADAYCQWRTYQTGIVHRLPTEAEWEKAARSYEGYHFSYGNEYDPTLANTESEGPRNVGSYPANGYGIYDLTGNVWEWIDEQYAADAYRQFLETYQNEIRNPRMFDPDQPYGRVIVRGGSFRSVNRINARTAVRYPMFPNDWHTNIGFRYIVVP
ncbi:SUMF1/EgtB/PvdO family nonheme iron enzyme [candidate division KSB3 bacterium]|uniref:SUMF1/EgtB/PvdO family nonheme iron enzyme n=1 Tax=candidate division KSB3 bacterium TaxID=2044937 RepID=A0A9D5Q4P2_9BACT|nr:SUMF1/EgtB/PvdO family nonheme iron enzyme [candidate division KSB3 bacterium]MBD3323924.1 SUMF1/EgtB/PvdO family nonheme iron enzyme [candidate division KSB3 bacterium]